MLTERSSYEEFAPALRKAANIKFYRAAAYRGARERARFSGKKYFFCELRSEGQPVLWMEHTRDRYSMAMLLVEGHDREGCTFPSVAMRQQDPTGNGEYVFVLRGHAVKRYVQRRIYHDDKHPVSFKEYTTARNAILESLLEFYAEADPVTRTYLVSYDSGVFICPPANDNVMVAETYQVVSKMYTNQRVTRGKSEEGTKIYKEAMTDELRRAFAVLTTIKEM